MTKSDYNNNNKQPQYFYYLTIRGESPGSAGSSSNRGGPGQSVKETEMLFLYIPSVGFSLYLGGVTPEK